MPKRKLTGTIVSHKMEKTAVVLVERIKKHPRYLKRIKQTKKYHAHDPANQYHEGEKVVIEECRPLSKKKRWRIISKVHDSSPNKIKNS